MTRRRLSRSSAATPFFGSRADDEEAFLASAPRAARPTPFQTDDDRFPRPAFLGHGPDRFQIRVAVGTLVHQKTCVSVCQPSSLIRSGQAAMSQKRHSAKLGARRGSVAAETRRTTSPMRATWSRWRGAIIARSLYAGLA